MNTISLSPRFGQIWLKQAECGSTHPTTEIETHAHALSPVVTVNGNDIFLSTKQSKALQNIENAIMDKDTNQETLKQNLPGLFQALFNQFAPFPIPTQFPRDARKEFMDTLQNPAANWDFHKDRIAGNRLKISYTCPNPSYTPLERAQRLQIMQAQRSGIFPGGTPEGPSGGRFDIRRSIGHLNLP